MIHNIKFLSGFPTSFPHLKDKTISFNPGFNVLFGENGCLSEDTLVATPDGAIAIKHLEKGDTVFDEFGKPIKILQKFNTGIKKVVELTSDSKVWAECTYDHSWLSRGRRDKKDKDIRTLDFDSVDHYIKRCYNTLSYKDKDKNVDVAYFLGAMLGDGCCKQNRGNGYYISNSEENVPKYLGTLLNGSYKKCTGDNYTWEIKSELDIEYYNEWCKDKYAHEKIIDIDEVYTWNRKSVLALIAGIIDTDGSIFIKRNKSLSINISMQSKSVVDAIEILFKDLWNILPNRYLDDNPKYKNGPCHVISVTRKQDARFILGQLLPFLHTESRTQHRDLAIKEKYSYIGVKFGKERYVQTYDIHVDSDTNLYCLANGFITHNCGKSTILKTLAAYSGIQKGGWSSISDPMKLASRSIGHFPYVYKAYTPANLDATVGWDGTPTFYNDSEMLNKNNFTWFFDSAVLSEDGITTGAEQLDVMAAKPSSGQYRIHKINKIMQVIQNPPNLAVVPPDISDKQAAAAEIQYIHSLPRNGKIALLFDEPEKALALPKQLELFNTLLTLSEHFQVIIATHSPFILFFKGANIIDINPGYANLCRNLIQKQVVPAKKK
jgi:energy-coupling factor transporter ATP-binding protein EcfA2